MKTKQFTITKRIAKHGNQAVICIPKILEQELCPGSIIKLNIEIVKDVKNEKRNL